jgi:DNA-binding MarR family transcriptional regulator
MTEAANTPRDSRVEDTPVVAVVILAAGAIARKALLSDCPARFFGAGHFLRRNIYKVMRNESKSSMPELPCACANLRRAARAATRIYNQELRSIELELTQYTLLMTLDLMGKTTQKALGELLAMDSTTLTRTLSFLLERRWVGANPGKDRREKLLTLTPAGRRKFQQAQPNWQRAQEKLRLSVGKKTWQQMGQMLTHITTAVEQI